MPSTNRRYNKKETNVPAHAKRKSNVPRSDNDLFNLKRAVVRQRGDIFDYDEFLNLLEESCDYASQEIFHASVINHNVARKMSRKVGAYAMEKALDGAKQGLQPRIPCIVSGVDVIHPGERLDTPFFVTFPIEGPGAKIMEEEQTSVLKIIGYKGAAELYPHISLHRTISESHATTIADELQSNLPPNPSFVLGAAKKYRFS